jgi:hypothetical protein
VSNFIHVDTEVLSGADAVAIMDFATQALRAVTNAYASDEVTYVVSNGDVVAAINPAVAGERYERAAEVMVQARHPEETLPVRVRAGRRRWWPGPFEGIF